MEIISKGLDETKKAVEVLLQLIQELDSRDVALVAALHGDLGAGKTFFTQELARQLNIKDVVTSPTFVIQKKYELPVPFKKISSLIHIDAYRLEKATDLLLLRWTETISNPANFVVIEWPERVAENIPENAFHIYFSFINETTRKIKL